MMRQMVHRETGPDAGEDAAARAAALRRDILVVVLTLTTGALDAATFIRLGHVFSSVITGNLVLMGVAAGEGSGTLAVNGGLALAGYAAGVIAGGAVSGTQTRGQPVWPRRVTVTLAVELLVLLAFGGGWLAAGGSPGGAGRLVLLVLGAAAMGLQSTAVRRLGQMSSTYMTSTLTGLLAGLGIGSLPPEWRRSLAVLVAIVTGAVVGAVTAVYAPWCVPVVVLLPEAAVVAAAAHRERVPRRPAASGSARKPG